MKKRLLFLALAATLIPWGLVCAEESSPYLVGEWFLSDSFNGGGTTTVNIIDTQFTFLNPTNQTLSSTNTPFSIKMAGFAAAIGTFSRRMDVSDTRCQQKLAERGFQVLSFLASPVDSQPRPRGL